MKDTPYYCPICGRETWSFQGVPAGARGVLGKFGCQTCVNKLSGYFFSEQARVTVTHCPFGHLVTPEIEPGEALDSPRIGWIRCDTCISQIELSIKQLLAIQIARSKADPERRIGRKVEETPVFPKPEQKRQPAQQLLLF